MLPYIRAEGQYRPSLSTIRSGLIHIFATKDTIRPRTILALASTLCTLRQSSLLSDHVPQTRSVFYGL